VSIICIPAAFTLAAAACAPLYAVFAPSRGSCAAPALAAGGMALHVVWLDDAGGRIAVRYRRSADAGKMWEAPVDLTPEPWRRSFPPSIAVSRGMVHVVWCETGQNPAGEIVHLRSVDGGMSWEQPRVLELEAGGAGFVSVATWSRSVHVAWVDRVGRLHFMGSGDDGLTWRPAMVIGRRQQEHDCAAAPRVHADGEVTYLWTDVRQDYPGMRAWLGVVPVFTGRIATVTAIDARSSVDGGVRWDAGAPLVKQAVDRATTTTCATLAEKKVSPHVLRHTTAMHLLQSGVDIAVIALWLGHESIETTHAYVEADLKTKEQALDKVAPAGKGFRRFQPGDKLLAFLESL